VNSALYPIIDNFERTLKFGRDEHSSNNLSVGGKGADGRLLIFSHQATIAFDVGTNDSRKPARHPLRRGTGSLFLIAHRERLSCYLLPAVN
jgi:hypothetical protein